MNLISGFEKGAYSFERECADKNLEFKNIELAEKRLEYWKKFLGPKLQYQFVHFLSFLPKYQNLT